MLQNNQKDISRGKMKRYSLISSVIFILASLALGLIQVNYQNETYSEKDIARFERVLHSKENVLNDEFELLKEEFPGNDPVNILNAQSDKYTKLAEDRGIYIFYFQEKDLVYWTDHTVPIQPRWNIRNNRGFIELRNASYVSVSVPADSGILYGLILIKTTFPYENEYLSNSFQKDFRMGSDVVCTSQHDDHLYKIKNKEGDFLFSLDVNENPKGNQQNVILSLFCFLIALLAIFSFFYWLIFSRESRFGRTISLLSSITVMALSFVLIFHFKFPGVVFVSSIFQPDVFANLTFSSLGNLWVFVLLVLFSVILFYMFFDRSGKIPVKYHRPIAFLLLLINSFWFILLHHILVSLVLDSNISFEAYKLNSLDLYTFISLFILALGFTALCLILDKALSYYKSSKSISQFLIVLLTVVLVQGPFLLTQQLHIEPFTPFFYLCFVLAIMYIQHSEGKKIRFSNFFFLIFFFALYSTLEFQKHSSEKTESQKEIELVKLSSERDVVAEMLFVELSGNIKNDSILMKRLSFTYFNIDLIYEYLQRNYFTGYWTKYNLQIAFCQPDDSVHVRPPFDNWFHCYDFFDEMILTEGMEVPQSDFYFLNNLNARISYLAKIPFYLNEKELSLFLELDSKIISEELGYPELLLKRESTETIPFSYARYNKGQLITSGGEFEYRLTPNVYSKQESTFEKSRFDGYDHSILNVDADNTVIVSTPVVSIVDKLISFTYIFAFSFILLSLGFLGVSAPRLRSNLIWDFKNKIQYSMIGILFLTFVFICAGTIYFIIEQYQTKHHNNLQNTMRSVYIELVHKVEYEEDLRNWSSDSYYNLDELLRKFSNVFYTDINMYDEAGYLLASSRAEIFNQQLLSVRMNRDAYEKLATEHYSAFIHTEHIGNLSYQSAYIPFMNSENQFLAYLNLPYFTQPEVLAQEATNLVVAILNIYVILLLLILFLSVFLADRITQPLRVIQNRIAQLSFSKKNEKITYNGKDEIHGLVDEYNFMVDELSRSAGLLAQSERETAWREMAKQIAHEIKNPLTPMKLNVQHLMRMVNEGDENIDEQIEKISQALIEQIDSLTSIANEFSDFAKMPKAKNQKINLITKLKNTAQLFQNSDKAAVVLDIGKARDIHVFGDPEQMQRLIINLVKNSIQSIPDNRKGVIKISAGITGDGNALLSVTDNGKGIPDSIQDKLFQPNFTTKGSGMGMGLAIASNIVTSMNGKIWFETEMNIGTTFFIILPFHED